MATAANKLDGKDIASDMEAACGGSGGSGATTCSSAAGGCPAHVPPQHAHLFTTPTDLVCPISLGLLSDPVATAVGQVYERTSIERHLLHCSLAGQPATDPITNAPLPSLSLLPVFPMRSRAAEFRAAAVRGCIAAAAAPRCLTPVAYLRRAAELLGSGGGVSGACGGHGAAAAAATGRPPASVQESLMTKLKTPTPPTVQQQQQQQQQQGAPDALSREFVSFLVAHPEPESDALILKYFGFELLRSGQAEAAANVFAGLLIGAGGRRTEQAEYLHLCLDAWAAAAAGGGGAAVGANIDSSAHHSSVSNNSDGNNTDGDYRPGSGHNVTLGQQQQQQQQSNNNSHHYHTATTTTTTALARRLADLTRGPGALLPSSLLEMLLSESPAAAAAVAPAGDALASELCAELLSRGAAAAAATASAADEAALGGLPGGLGGALALLLELQRLKERTAARALDNLRGQVEELCSAAAAVGLLLGGSSSTARCSGGGGRAAAAVAGSSSSSSSASSNTAIGAAAAAGQEHSLAAGVDGGPEAATAAARSQGSGEYGAKSCCGEVSGGGGADASALPVATQRRRQRLRGACSGWRRKKGAAFALGHAARLAAAGGLAVASLLDGNGVVLRAARLAPLLYLLRSGL